MSFKLKPMSLGVVTDVRECWRKQRPGQSVEIVFRECVLDWKGVEDNGSALAFSPASVDAIVESPTTDDFIWGRQIVMELFERFQVGVPELKN